MSDAHCIHMPDSSSIARERTMKTTVSLEQQWAWARANIIHSCAHLMSNVRDVNPVHHQKLVAKPQLAIEMRKPTLNYLRDVYTRISFADRFITPARNAEPKALSHRRQPKSHVQHNVVALDETRNLECGVPSQ